LRGDNPPRLVSPSVKSNANFVSLLFSKDELFLLVGREEEGHDRDEAEDELKEDAEEAEEEEWDGNLCCSSLSAKELSPCSLNIPSCNSNYSMHSKMNLMTTILNIGSRNPI